MPLSKVKTLGGVAGSILAVISLVTLLYNWYDNYADRKSLEDRLELEALISDISLKTVTTETSSEITKTKSLLDSLQGVISKIQEGSEYFAIGFRGDGSGKVWYRDKFGKVFPVYTYQDTIRYYINEQGLAVYI